MNILYLGDIMGLMGIEVVEQVLPDVVTQLYVDVVIAQGENVDGKGMTISNMDRLLRAGVHFFSGGNHTPYLPELHSRLLDVDAPVIGPANMTACPGRGYKYLTSSKGKVLVVSLMGSMVGSASSIEATNPLSVIDTILASQSSAEKTAIIVNFHGDFSSEKVIIGHYLDGRVTAVIGDHWHVPTADARLLPKGTAHISDVGMCGSLDSSLGVTFDSVVPRWRDGKITKNTLETTGAKQFNALLVSTHKASLLANSVMPIRKIVQ